MHMHVTQRKLIAAKWHIYVGKQSHSWFRQWLVACMVPSHYLNQCCFVVNRTTFSWILMKMNKEVFIDKIHLKMLSAEGQLIPLGLNVLTSSCISWSQHGQPPVLTQHCVLWDSFWASIIEMSLVTWGFVIFNASDGMALPRIRKSAGAVLMESGSSIYTKMAPKGLW